MLTSNLGHLWLCRTYQHWLFRYRNFAPAHARSIITLHEHRLPHSEDKYVYGEDNGDDIRRQNLFGSNVVKAALTAKRRSFTHLFTYDNDPLNRKIVSMAQEQGVDVIDVENRGVLNNMSGNRPHNGFVLECSELPEIPIAALGTKSDMWLPIKANSNPMWAVQETVQSSRQITDAQSHPVYILLDEVTDPQNIGSIIRTSYFLGATGIILSKKNCAPISPVAAKASSGATEFLPIMHVDSTVSFMKASRRNKWTFLASVSPHEKRNESSRCSLNGLRMMLAKGPICLVMGSEGNGLRTLVRNECTKFISVPASPHIDPVVDSLNVGTATATILSFMLLRE